MTPKERLKNTLTYLYWDPTLTGLPGADLGIAGLHAAPFRHLGGSRFQGLRRRAGERQGVASLPKELSIRTTVATARLAVRAFIENVSSDLTNPEVRNHVKAGGGWPPRALMLDGDKPLTFAAEANPSAPAQKVSTDSVHGGGSGLPTEGLGPESLRP